MGFMGHFEPNMEQNMGIFGKYGKYMLSGLPVMGINFC